MCLATKILKIGPKLRELWPWQWKYPEQLWLTPWMGCDMVTSVIIFRLLKKKAFLCFDEEVGLERPVQRFSLFTLSMLMSPSISVELTEVWWHDAMGGEWETAAVWVQEPLQAPLGHRDPDLAYFPGQEDKYVAMEAASERKGSPGKVIHEACFFYKLSTKFSIVLDTIRTGLHFIKCF